MKKFIIPVFIVLILGSFLVFKTLVIDNPKPENCVIVQTKITNIMIGSSFDIVFYDNGSDFYYINRGLERGLNLDSLNVKVLNKTVTLHLAKILGGITSEHISQLTVGDEIIFTEFD